MTAYIANHQKKNRIFAKRVRELQHAIKHDYSVEKLVAAAERVREAKMNVFKCQYTKSNSRQPHWFVADRIAAGNKQIQLWLAMSAEEIVAMYRQQPGGGGATSMTKVD